MRPDQSTSLCDIKFKIVFLGDMGVGKTSIIERFVNGDFQNANNPTIGIDFLCRNILVENKTYRLQLWDTAGQQKYKSLVPAYLRDANCAVFVVDITKQQSFKNLPSWIQLFRDNEKSNSKAVLMANKIDLVDRKAINNDILIDYSKKQGLMYSEVSAKTGQGVNQCFNEIVKSLNLSFSVSREDQQYAEVQNQFLKEYEKLKKTHEQKKLSCCYI